jgi:ketosteroid isomerase-like protein
MTDPSSPEADIRGLLAEYAAAHAASDAERVLGLYVPGAVSYTLAPPLQQGPDTPYGTVEGLKRWFATFDGPVDLSYRDVGVTVDGSVGYAHTLTCMTATPAGAGESFMLWFRSTFGVRYVAGAWRIGHRHESTPFHMDGSLRAATDLQP